MSRKPSFANLRGPAQAPVPAPSDAAQPRRPGGAAPSDVAEPRRPGGAADAAEQGRGPASRQGRKQIAGFFSPEMSLAMHMLARRQGRSLQALMAEAFNDVLRKHGESPIGD